MGCLDSEGECSIFCFPQVSERTQIDDQNNPGPSGQQQFLHARRRYVRSSPIWHPHTSPVCQLKPYIGATPCSETIRTSSPMRRECLSRLGSMRKHERQRFLKRRASASKDRVSFGCRGTFAGERSCKLGCNAYLPCVLGISLRMT